jgi:polysaccharide deacetylase family protein (PEP-CTERM system associated)
MHMSAQPQVPASASEKTPTNTPMCVFTVDVEDYFQVDAFSRVIQMDNWDSFALRVEANTRRILDLLDEKGVKGTFFVLGWVARRQPQLVREIANRGHEIASHGMSHRRVVTQTPEVFRAETRESKQLLEDIVQQKILGYRAATYSITKESLWALDILCEEGFVYDSSIFPVRHDRYGIPDATIVPHRLRTQKGAEIAEFPLTVWQPGGVNVPIAGGGYFRLFPYGFTRYGFRKVREAGRPVVFYLHPWEVDPEQPRVEGAGWKSRFRHYLNLGKTHDRLSQLLTDFPFGTMRDCLSALKLL